MQKPVLGITSAGDRLCNCGFGILNLREAALGYVKDSGLDLLGLSYVPEVLAEISAGSSCNIHL